MINIALPKGRLGEKAYGVFEEIGYGCPSIRETNRKLIFENEENGVRYFWVKPSDVAVYVERGVADVGVVGKDILLEQSSDVYELLDLDMGKCRMAVAGKKGGRIDTDRTLRVATKFPHIAREYYRKQSLEIEIIELHGSIEIAPILGMSDVIVDIVETGTTLLENDLEPWEDIVPISARLIANKASYKFLNEPIRKMCETMNEVIKTS
ncbi:MULTISPECIES: ATP phosphoribosyltransferase [Anaerotignum]|uniref:ATP phosphoribosyltransferase n=1 Tax=Anaerotignum TaxID=2039240 RepID=UPI00210BA3F8|nr:MULTISPECIES: ATP phosphoribosyltransferase [Anaerotignum]MCQ4934881.1 ATP phosphoribosyltransferase [Anaerotignum propionicum]